MGAGAAVALYQLSFFAAVDRCGVTVGTLVMMATAPAVAGLAGWALERRRPSATWALATLMALAGAAVLVLGSGTIDTFDIAGVLLAVAAGAAFAGYSVAGRRASQGGDTMAATSWIFLVAALLLAVPLARQDLAFATEGRNPLVLGWLALAATTAAYLLYQAGLARIDAATAATLALAEPMVANLLAVLVLGEAFGWTMGLGVLMVICGLALLARD